MKLVVNVLTENYRENKDSPLTMDLATSAISWFAIVLSKLAGQELPPGVAVDKKGHLTTNPAKALEGAILPFGGINSHKGSALALAVELFTNGLACGAIENKKQSQNWASFVLAIDPVCFHDTLEIFTRRIENILTRVKQAKKLLPSKEGIKKKILLPGERGDHQKKNQFIQQIHFIRLQFDTKIISKSPRTTTTTSTSITKSTIFFQTIVNL
jgi:LDH2 family malate/lactate/ureidoglycolate dehydrogenase